MHTSSRPVTRLSRPKAIHEPRHMVSSTSSRSEYAALNRAQNSSSRPWCSVANRSAYSAARATRGSSVELDRQALTSSKNPLSTFSPSRSVR